MSKHLTHLGESLRQVELAKVVYASTYANKELSAEENQEFFDTIDKYDIIIYELNYLILKEEGD